MKLYLGKDRQRTAQHLTATHATVTELTRKVGHGHKLYMDNFFSSPALFDDLAKKHTLLCPCQSEQERHATRPSIEDNKIQKVGHSCKDQG